MLGTQAPLRRRWGTGATANSTTDPVAEALGERDAVEGVEHVWSAGQQVGKMARNEIDGPPRVSRDDGGADGCRGQPPVGQRGAGSERGSAAENTGGG